MKSCEFTTSEASTKSWFRTNGLIDKFLNILDLNKFRTKNTEFSNYAKTQYGVEGRLFYEEQSGKKAFPNTTLFHQIDAAKGNWYKENEYLKNRQFQKQSLSLTTEQTNQIEELKQSDPRWNKYSNEDIQRFIDSVFPESQVKEIVYHGTDLEPNSVDFKTNRGGIFLASTPIYASYFSEQDNAYPALINFKNGYQAKGLTDNVGKDAISQIKARGYDSVIGKGGITKMQQHKNDLEFIAFELPQVYILNSDKAFSDMEKFVGNDNIAFSRKPSNFVRNVNELGEQFEKSPYESKSYKIQQIQTILKKELPVGIVNSVTIVNDVPSSILGRNDLFLSLKNILNDNGINDELLINWVGLNKDKIGYSPYAIHYESTIENIIKKSYEKKKNESEYLEFKTNKLAKESFYKWIESLEKYPLAFKEVMLTHAVKWLNNPNRKSKYVLQLSDVALQNAYGIVVNKPHELNRIGKLYDQEVLKTVSDAVKHEPSASGNGYWVHVPKTSNEDKKQFDINIELLKKLSPSTWCTSGGLTRHYVENYDNYILIVNGITVAGIEVTDKINSNNQRIVKEVTSRNNNGIASVDHLDDTVAFFEKHNLDLSNESLQNAIKAKENDKTDKDLGNEYEEEPWLNYDFEPRDFYDFEDDNIPDNRQEFLEPWEEELNMLYDYNIEQALAYLESEKEGKVLSAFSPLVMSNEEVVKKIIQIDPEMIVEVNPLLTFYLEVAHQAVLKKPSVYSYISEEAKQEKRNIDLYNEYLAQVRDRVKEGDDLPFSKTINNQIQGYYDANNDKVVLIANNIDVNEASKIAIHEIAHRGMIRMGKELGGMNELNQILLNAESELMKKLPELLKRTGHSTLEELVKDYGFTINSKEGKSKLLMELAARWAETLVNKSKPSWWKEFIQSIKNWIKQFTGKTLNENKVNELVGGFVKYGTQNKNLNSFIFESFKEEKGESNTECFL